MKPVARLSIFNFRTLKETPKPTAALCAAVLGLLIIRIIMFIGEDILMFSPQDEQRYYAFRNDARYIEDAYPKPQALIMGTSRLTVLDPGYIARPLHLDDSEILNYAVPGLTFWHVKTFFERNAEITQNLELVVIDMLPFQLSEGKIFSQEDPYFIGFSSVSDAWSSGSFRSIFIKGANSIWPAWSQRRRIPEWIATGKTAFTSPDTRREAFLNYVKPFRVIQKRQQAIGMAAIKTYSSERVSPVQIEALKALPDLLPDDATLVLIWLPVNEVYEKELQGNGETGESYREFKSEVTRFHHPKLHQIWVESPDTIGLVPSEFLDEVHYGERGMAKVGAFIEKRLTMLLEEN